MSPVFDVDATAGASVSAQIITYSATCTAAAWYVSFSGASINNVGRFAVERFVDNISFNYEHTGDDLIFHRRD